MFHQMKYGKANQIKSNREENGQNYTGKYKITKKKKLIRISVNSK